MRKVKFLTLLLLAAIVLTGCNAYKKMTYVIDEDETVNIKLDLSGKYDINDKSPFTITKNEKDVCTGIFLSASTYNNYMISISKDQKTSIIEQGEQKNIDYIFYQYDASKPEYNYLIKFKESGVGLIIRNSISSDSSTECFKHLKF